MLAVLTAEQLAHSMFPLGELTKPQVRAEAARRGFAVAGQARLVRHLLHPGRRHPRLPGRQAGRPAGCRRRRGRPASSSPSTTASSPTPSVSARACGCERPAPDGRPRYVLGIEPVTGTVTVGPASGLDVRLVVADRVVFPGGARPEFPLPGAGPAAGARRDRRRLGGSGGRRAPAEPGLSRSAGWRPGRPWCCTAVRVWTRRPPVPSADQFVIAAGTIVRTG